MAARAYVDHSRVTLGLAGMASRARAGAERATRHHTRLLVTRIQANASGRPGPNAPTGDYRRSWTMEVKSGLGGVEGIAGTNKPQARRLEYGFVGTDSLGRTYDQPPYPHVQPALDEVAPEYIDAMRGLMSP